VTPAGLRTLFRKRATLTSGKQSAYPRLDRLLRGAPSAGTAIDMAASTRSGDIPRRSAGLADAIETVAASHAADV
jgi:hypothetical protein